MTTNKINYTVLLLIISVVFMANNISFINGHDWGGDFSLYISQAKTLVEGNFSEHLSNQQFRYDYTTAKVGPVMYSWGFPILLSPVYYVFGLDIHAMKIYLSLFFLLSIILVFLIFRDELSTTDNLLLVSMYAFNTWFFDFKDAVLSDVPFMFFAMLSIYLIKRIVIKKQLWINSIVSYSLLGISIFSALYIREVGVFLLPALLISQYIENKRSSKNLKEFFLSDTAKFIPYLVIAAITIAISFTPLSRSNMGRALYEFSFFKPTVLFLNIKYYFFIFSRFFSFLKLEMSSVGLDYNKYSLVFYVIMVVVAFWGLFNNRKKDYLYVLFGFFTISLLLFFPHRQGARFVIQLFPFFLYFLFKGLTKISIHLERSNYKPLTFNAAYLYSAGAIIIALVYMSFGSYQSIIFNKTEVYDGPYTPDSIELFDYIKSNTQKDDAIIFFKPRVMMLYTDRKSFALTRYKFTPDKMFNSPAQYVVVSKTSYIPNDLRVQELPGNLQCEFENSAFLLCDLREYSGH